MYTNSTNVFLTRDLNSIRNTSRISEVSAVIRLLKHLYFLLLSNVSHQLKKKYIETLNSSQAGKGKLILCFKKGVINLCLQNAGFDSIQFK